MKPQTLDVVNSLVAAGWKYCGTVQDREVFRRGHKGVNYTLMLAEDGTYADIPK